MRFSELGNSRFLKKEDVMPPVTVTIDRFEEMNVAPDGQKQEIEWVIFFKELEKPMVLKPTNGAILSSIFKVDEATDTIGKSIVLYNEPSVSFNKKITGGIRIRAVDVQEASRNTQPKNSTAESFAADHNIPLENKDNAADYLMTYNTLPKPTPAQIANIKKICLAVFKDAKCEIKNRMDIWSYFAEKWPDTEQEVSEAIESSLIPF